MPDAIERVVRAFERARAFEVEVLGYRPPPVEGKYQLYVGYLEGAGYTQPSPGSEGRVRGSHVVVPLRLVRAGATWKQVASFAAHEYFHAIQFGYDWLEDRWVKESTAAWVEDFVVDRLNPNHYLLPSFLPYPRVPLPARGGNSLYGSWIFFQFLAERYGGEGIAGASFIRELWEEMAETEAFEGAGDKQSVAALETVLARRGVALHEAWAEFLLWQWRIGKFEEGDAFTKVLVGTPWRSLLRDTRVRTESCRLTSDTATGQQLGSFSGDFVRLRPGWRAPDEARATLKVEGPAGASAFALLRPLNGSVQESLLHFGSDGVATMELDFGFLQARSLTLGLGMGAESPRPVTLGYSLRYEGENKVTAAGPYAPDRIIYGEGFPLIGRVDCRGKPAAWANVVVTETEVASGETRTYSTTTDNDGMWTVVVSPPVNVRYSFEVVDPLLSSAASPSVATGVQVDVLMEVVDDVIRQSQPLEVRGSTRPVHAGVPVVIEYRRPERDWQVGVRTVIDARGEYEARLSLPGTGIWEVRARVEDTHDADHLPGPSVSALVQVTDS